MDFCRNVSVSSGLPSEHTPEQLISHTSSKLEEFFPGETKESDVGLEWLSIFLEDCFSSTGNYTSEGIEIHPPTQNPTTNPVVHSENHQKPSLQELVVPGKARTKRRRANGRLHEQVDQQSLNVTASDPPLLHQAYWLADSELIVPQKKEKEEEVEEEKEKEEVEEEEEEEEEEKTAKLSNAGSSEGDSLGSLDSGAGQPRRCTHCLSQRTPQWRAGPMGPKTLCNACGVRFKSGRLLPEYRPAKSPTFVSYKHSNSHKKVMEMRMAL